MNAIIGFTGLLNDQDLIETDKQELISHIVHNSDTLLHLIDDIIDIAKIEAGQLNINKKDCYINIILNELLETYTEKKKLHKKNNIELRLNPGVKNDNFIIFTDTIRVQQIFLNLIDNALKFTEKGYIEFGYNLEKETEDPSIIFYVKDTGIGLSEDQQGMVFSRFTLFVSFLAF